jgi:uncharacterized protein (TIGR02722 family)
MKKSLKLIALGILPVLIVTGCSTPPQRIESGGPTAVTTMGVDIQDFKNAAGEMVKTLIMSGALDRQGGGKSIVAVGNIINDTDRNFDTDQISFKITTDLANSGKTMTINTYGKNAADKVGQAVVNEKNFLNDNKGATKLPDLTLAGKILSTHAREGHTREVTYTFQLFLTDTSTGLTVWQDERNITKQTTRASAGF